MGEHSAVFGRPAIVAAIDRRLTVEIRPNPSPLVVLDLADLELTVTVDWAEVMDYTARVRELWQLYREDRRPETLAAMVGDDPAHLVKVSLGEAAAGLPDAPHFGVHLDVRSEIPVGSGFGSSAAIAAGVSAAYFEARGFPADLDRLRRVSLEVEKRQHGMPSGIDSACVVSGGVLWCRRDRAGRLKTREQDVPNRRMSCFRLIDTGRPHENTGQVVAAVRQRFDARPHLVDEMAAATREFGDALSRTAEDGSIEQQIHRFQACLEELEIVPRRIRQIVRTIEACGGAAKISGAGTLTGDSAGALLVYHRQPGVLEQHESLASLLDPGTADNSGVGLGACGVKSESMS